MKQIKKLLFMLFSAAVGITMIPLITFAEGEKEITEITIKTKIPVAFDISNKEEYNQVEVKPDAGYTVGVHYWEGGNFFIFAEGDHKGESGFSNKELNVLTVFLKPEDGYKFPDDLINNLTVNKICESFEEKLVPLAKSNFINYNDPLSFEGSYSVQNGVNGEIRVSCAVASKQQIVDVYFVNDEGRKIGNKFSAVTTANIRDLEEDALNNIKDIKNNEIPKDYEIDDNSQTIFAYDSNSGCTCQIPVTSTKPTKDITVIYQTSDGRVIDSTQKITRPDDAEKVFWEDIISHIPSGYDIDENIRSKMKEFDKNSNTVKVTVKPNTPNQPANPETPDKPEIPEVSEKPVTPVTPVKPYKPVTQEEKKRFSMVGGEIPQYSVNSANDYEVDVYNSVQGPKCFVSFEAVLGEYKMARTYNIFPNNQQTYQMDGKARITLEIPEKLRKEGRVFRMICVTKDGRPYVLRDLDKNDDTITFETDKYYAFALIYK